MIEHNEFKSLSNEQYFETYKMTYKEKCFLKTSLILVIFFCPDLKDRKKQMNKATITLNNAKFLNQIDTVILISNAIWQIV